MVSTRYEIDAEIFEFYMARKTGIHRRMNVKIKIDAQNIKNAALNSNKNRNKNRKIKTAQTQCLSHFQWQGQKDLNPRHAVLETAALPTELYPCIADHISIAQNAARCQEKNLK